MKKIILIFLVFLTCGCTVNYEVSINNNSYSEKIIISDLRSTLGANNKNEFLDKTLEVYKKNWPSYSLNNTIISNTNYYYDVSATFNSDDKFLKNSMLNIFFNVNTITTDASGNKLYSFTYVPENDDEEGSVLGKDEKLRIIISSQNKLINANYDEITNGKYIWILKADNKRDIHFEIAQSKNEVLDTNQLLKPIVIVLGILFIGIIAVFKKSKRNQKI